MFKKLNFSLKHIPDFNKLKGIKITSFGEHPFPILSYYSVKDYEYLKTFLPDNLKYLPFDQLMVAEIIDSNIGHLDPHIDHGVTTVFNYYLETCDAVTHFYELKEGEFGYNYQGRETANIYDFNQVIKTGSFTARNNEAYILDVSKIHSVESIRAGTRQFIQWQWNNMQFEQVHKLLNLL